MTNSLYAPGSVLTDVAVFPLPQVVLFPGALMPLHVFEPRYRAMTRDVIATTRRICIAQIPEDHDLDEHGQPSVVGVAGVGEIVKCDALPDGRFNILVEGKARAKLHELPFKRPYRRADLTILGSSGAEPEPALVRALVSTASTLAGLVRKCHPGFQFCLPESRVAADVADACAHYLVLDGAERQKLLEELDVDRRVKECLEVLMSQQTLLGGGPETMH
ncbi:MAG TPA: LON peptidase substrate-binding domain-containing protein [Polyangiaceae bacterium]|nr:LON peptidase substrate-binding domain-containing protein [Polyangiaceae bacterium]